MKLVNKLVLPMMFSAVIMAQPTIKNAEDFKIGTTLKFMVCESEGVKEGNAGADQTWDFSTLQSKKDTITEWMVSPSAVPAASLFPEATFVEKYSDGKYVFAKNSGDRSFLLGFNDERSKILIKYPDPVLFAVRPMTYTTTVTDLFKDEFSFGNMDFKGTGSATVTADGYGTLVLPNAKYSNVLRVKITQVQNDSLLQYKSMSITISTTYVWFDEKHTSALLKIDATDSGAYKSKSVEFLLSETYEDKNKK